jgi:hypothetical protein
MTRADKALVILLRFVGVGALFALVAVFMPSSWMAATHRRLGMGEMPTGPVVEYLARFLDHWLVPFHRSATSGGWSSRPRLSSGRQRRGEKEKSHLPGGGRWPGRVCGSGCDGREAGRRSWSCLAGGRGEPPADRGG